MLALRNEPDASIWWRGRFWPVTAHFHAETTAIWPELHDMEWETVDAERHRLLEEDERRGLSESEHAQLHAYTRHWNLRSNIAFLEGRDCRDFGWSEYDICHGWRGTFDCGCVLHGVFDHYLTIDILDNKTPGASIAIHPHYPRRVCSTHAHLRHDLKTLMETVMADAALMKAQMDDLLGDAGRPIPPLRKDNKTTSNSVTPDFGSVLGARP